MYSRIPVPRVEWREENRRFALCFFPLVGAVLAAAELAWYWLYAALGFNPLLFGAGAASLTLIVTGGIHMDGYCDVCDALASWGGREKMLAVMDDPHIGSFAAVRAALYVLLQAGLFAQAGERGLMLECALVFVQSRSFSTLAAVTFKSAKAEGTLQSFRRPADKRAVIASGLAFLAATLAAALYTDPLCGLCAFLGEGLCFIYYRLMSYKKFGGVTGDLAGYFLQLCELAAAGFAVFADLIRSFAL